MIICLHFKTKSGQNRSTIVDRENLYNSTIGAVLINITHLNLNIK